MATIEETVDALVIGSGFGGSIAAFRLAQAGVKTVVLERGRKWDFTPEQDTFTTYRNPDGRAAWLSDTTVLFAPKPIDVYTGILQRKIGDGITVWAAAGVGGGSVVFNTVLLKPTEENFNKVFGSYGVTFQEVDPFYHKVASVIGPDAIPDDVLESDYYLSSRVFRRNAELANLPIEKVTLASSWDVVREELAGEKKPAAIVGEIWYGINSGVKKSVDKNYLRQAQHLGLVEVRPLHNVTKISEGHGGHGFAVEYDVIDTKGNVLNKGIIRTKHVFLGAGSINTSELLVRAKALNHLPNLNEHVGKFWGNNGDSFATREVGVETNYDKGGPASFAVKHYDNKFAPISIIVFPEWDAPKASLTTLAMTLAEPLGEFSYDAATDTVKLTWPADDPRLSNVVDAANETYRILDSVLDQLEAEHTPASIDKERFYGHSGEQAVSKKQEKTEASAAVTAHPCGGVVISKATDLFGRVHGYKGLYVVDGAFIPGCTAACNPAYTIAAFAERNLHHILKEDFSIEL